MLALCLLKSKMLFKFLKPKIVLDVFTDRQTVFDQYKVDRAIKFLPKYWNKLPNHFMEDGFVPRPTMRTCPGIIKNYKEGFILPLWSDIVISCEEQEEETIVRWSFADGRSVIEYHPSEQWSEFLDPKEYFHIKINSPWFFRTKKNIKFYWSNPYWNNEPLKFTISPGITDFQYSHETHFNTFFEKKRKNIFLEQNTPLCHFIPMTEKDVIIKQHLISSIEREQFVREKSYFLSSWAKQKYMKL